CRRLTKRVSRISTARPDRPLAGSPSIPLPLASDASDALRSPPTLTAPMSQDHRDFLAIPDFTTKELESLFDLAERMKSGKYTKQPLAGKSLAMIFMKSST